VTEGLQELACIFSAPELLAARDAKVLVRLSPTASLGKL